jgi:hypothetical protein
MNVHANFLNDFLKIKKTPLSKNCSKIRMQACATQKKRS